MARSKGKCFCKLSKSMHVYDINVNYLVDPAGNGLLQ